MRVYPKSREEAERLKADYEFLGIDVRIEDGVLVIGQPRAKKKNKNDKNEKGRRSTKRRDS